MSKHVFTGFWKWAEEMARLDLHPHMDEVLRDRALESREDRQAAQAHKAQAEDEMDAILRSKQK
jgi:outer membrane murein-binding lipoprotein Lpp